MGLDMTAHVELKDEPMEEPLEIAYWRKHNALHNWMEQLWIEKGRPGAEEDSLMFNCINLYLEKEDLDRLEAAIDGHKLTPTSGFFFGSTSYTAEDWEYYDRADRAFIAAAREALDEGNKVYYSSWW